MDNTNKTAREILLEAADLLEQEKKHRWGQGKYFQNFTDKGCTMCAHGAIAYCGDPKVREKVNAGAAAGSGAAAAAPGAAAAGSGAVAAAGGAAAAVERITPEEYIRKYYNGEVGLAHYRAARAGLTIRYNDNPKITKQDVINKLREAAQL